jgi:hypothetical protein
VIINYSEHDVAPSQPLNLPRTSRWIPPSQYYGDKFPRTLEEAFGPGAELTIHEPTAWTQARCWVLTVLSALLIVAISWAVSC